MTVYKDVVNFVPHNLVNSVFTVDGENNLNGIETIEVEFDEDEVTFQAVADGMAIANENPIRKGQLRVSFLEASPSSKVMWDLRESGAFFPVSFSDSASPDLKANGQYCRIMKPPVLKRLNETDITEWVIVTGYLKARGGGYKLVNAA